MLEEKEIPDSVTYRANGCIEVRRARVILKDGVEIARTYHRHVLSPGDDVSAEDPRIIAVTEIVWTPEVIQAWRDFLASQQPA